MKKQVIVMAIIVFLFCIGFSGCINTAVEKNEHYQGNCVGSYSGTPGETVEQTIIHVNITGNKWKITWLIKELSHNYEGDIYLGDPFLQVWIYRTNPMSGVTVINGNNNNFGTEWIDEGKASYELRITALNMKEWVVAVFQ